MVLGSGSGLDFNPFMKFVRRIKPIGKGVYLSKPEESGPPTPTQSMPAQFNAMNAAIARGMIKPLSVSGAAWGQEQGLEAALTAPPPAAPPPPIAPLYPGQEQALTDALTPGGPPLPIYKSAQELYPKPGEIPGPEHLWSKRMAEQKKLEEYNLREQKEKALQDEYTRWRETASPAQIAKYEIENIFISNKINLPRDFTPLPKNPTEKDWERYNQELLDRLPNALRVSKLPVSEPLKVKAAAKKPFVEAFEVFETLGGAAKLVAEGVGAGMGKRGGISEESRATAQAFKDFVTPGSGSFLDYGETTERAQEQYREMPWWQQALWTLPLDLALTAGWGTASKALRTTSAIKKAQAADKARRLSNLGLGHLTEHPQSSFLTGTGMQKYIVRPTQAARDAAEKAVTRQEADWGRLVRPDSPEISAASVAARKRIDELYGKNSEWFKKRYPKPTPEELKQRVMNASREDYIPAILDTIGPKELETGSIKYFKEFMGAQGFNVDDPEVLDRLHKIFIAEPVAKVADSMTGGGTFLGALHIGSYDLVHVDEYSPEIVALFNKIWKTNIEPRDIADMRQAFGFENSGATHYHASPECKRFSRAHPNSSLHNIEKIVNENDRAIAMSVARNLRTGMPATFSLENVPAYGGYVDRVKGVWSETPEKRAALLNIITDTLDELGYKWDMGVYNAADYGGSQDRKRLILRAVRGKKDEFGFWKYPELPGLPERIGGTDWYTSLRYQIEAAKSAGAGKLVKDVPRWNEEKARIIASINKGKLSANEPIITTGAMFRGSHNARQAGRVGPTLTVSGKKRIILPDPQGRGFEYGIVIDMTPEMQRIYMGLPDSYRVPKTTNELTDTIFGNGIHGIITRGFLQPLVDMSATMPKATRTYQREAAGGIAARQVAEAPITTARAGALPEGAVEILATPETQRIGNVAVVEGGQLRSIHVTSDPSRLEEILRVGGDISQTRDPGLVGDLGIAGIYFSNAPQLWTGRATAKWNFLRELSQAQRTSLSESLEQEIRQLRRTRYITESEEEYGLRYIREFKERPDFTGGVVQIADQPFNVSFWKPDFLSRIGIEQARPPAEVPIVLRGRFADISGVPSARRADAVAALKEQGFDGALVQGHMMGDTPQGVVWNRKAIEQFGEVRPTTAASAKEAVVPTARAAGAVVPVTRAAGAVVPDTVFPKTVQRWDANEVLQPKDVNIEDSLLIRPELESLLVSSRPIKRYWSHRPPPTDPTLGPIQPTESGGIRAYLMPKSPEGVELSRQFFKEGAEQKVVWLERTANPNDPFIVDASKLNLSNVAEASGGYIHAGDIPVEALVKRPGQTTREAPITTARAAVPGGALQAERAGIQSRGARTGMQRPLPIRMPRLSNILGDTGTALNRTGRNILNEFRERGQWGGGYGGRRGGIIDSMDSSDGIRSEMGSNFVNKLLDANVRGNNARDLLRRLSNQLAALPDTTIKGRTVGLGAFLRTLINSSNPSAIIERSPIRMEGLGYMLLEEFQGAQASQRLSALARSPFKKVIGDDGKITLLDKRRVEFGDVAQDMNKYAPFLTREQREWIEAGHELLDDMVRLYEKSTGKEFPKLEMGQGMRYWPRWIETKGKYTAARGKVGAKAGILKKRFYDLQEDGVKGGVNYKKDPLEQVELYVHAIHKMIRDEVFVSRITKRVKGEAGPLGPSGIDRRLARRPGPGDWDVIRKRKLAEQGEVMPDDYFQLRNPAIFRKEDWKELQAFLPKLQRADLTNFEKLNKYAGSVSSLLRTLQAGAFDLGQFTIQGSILFFRSPIRWSKAVHGAFRAMIDPDFYMHWRQYSPESQLASKYGIDLGLTSEFFESGLLQSRVGAPIRPFQRSFETFIGMGRAYMFDGFAQTASRKASGNALEEELMRLARYTDTMLGVTSSRALGVSATQRSIENAWVFFSPRYTRSLFGVFSNTLAGGRVGVEARRALGQTLIGGALTYWGIGKAMGKSDEELLRGLNPLNGKRFLSYEIGGRWYGIGGGLRSMMTLMAAPLDTDNWKNTVTGKFIYDWLRMRQPPVASSLMDYLGGDTPMGVPMSSFFGEEWKGMKPNKELLDYAQSKVLPFPIQAAYEMWGEEVPILSKEMATAVGTEFLGGRTSGETFTDAANDEARALGWPEYRNAEPWQKAHLEQLERTKAAKEKRERYGLGGTIDDIESRFEAELQQIEADLSLGNRVSEKAAVNKYYEEIGEMSKQKMGARMHEHGPGMGYREGDTPGEKALNEFFNIGRNEGEGKDYYDPDYQTEQQNAFMKQLRMSDLEAYEYVLRNTNIDYLGNLLGSKSKLRRAVEYHSSTGTLARAKASRNARNKWKAENR